MADKVTLASVATFQNDTSAVTTINNNNALITTAMDNTLSRDGTSPNQMGANLDMNSNQIINLPAPATVNSPARLVDVASNPTITVPATGTSGATVPLLNTSVTWSGGTTQTFSGALTVTGAATFNGTTTFNSTVTLPSTFITGSNLVNNTVGNAQLRQGIARSVIGVTGNATANEADIQGTTRQVLSINTAGTALAFAQPQGDQLLGTVTNDSATAGNVGEYVESIITAGAAISTTSNTNLNVTSISLTAGDWEVSGCVSFVGAATTRQFIGNCGLTTTSLTFDLTAGRYINAGYLGTAGMSNFISNTSAIEIGPRRFSLGTTTTIYLVANTTFDTSTMSTYGILRARRVR